MKSTTHYVESKSVNDVYQMSEAEREAVNEGLKEFKNGPWITHEESNKRAEEWLRNMMVSKDESGQDREL